jgi:RimJ/RimL family protein N-acetyltransferase
MQKSGMTFEGTIRDCVQKDGRFIDTPIYSILRREWEPSSE